jgi:hypothetical protein
MLNLAVATLISVPVVAAGWLVQKRLEPGPNLRSCKMTFGRLLDQSVRDAGKKVRAIIGEIAAVTQSTLRVLGEESLG